MADIERVRVQGGRDIVNIRLEDHEPIYMHRPIRKEELQEGEAELVDEGGYGASYSEINGGTNIAVSFNKDETRAEISPIIPGVRTIPPYSADPEVAKEVIKSLDKFVDDFNKNGGRRRRQRRKTRRTKTSRRRKTLSQRR